MKKHSLNPIITTEAVKPSRPDFRVDCVFNAAATTYNNETILLLRVAESFIDSTEEIYQVPVIENGDVKKVTINRKEKEAEGWDFSDKRTISAPCHRRGLKVVYLTSLSHLRLARSTDGVHFEIDDQPFIFPQTEEEAWGCEDPRIVHIDDTYYINYTAVSERGICTMLTHTKDFKKYEREGLIFAPENRNVAIFPEKVGDKYIAFNRPAPEGIGNPAIWLAESPDLIHWGNQKFISSVQEFGWETGRIGAGFSPIKTEAGWLFIYHAADVTNRYCLGAMLLDLQDPSIIISRLDHPILEPTEDYEIEGFFGGVVFTCGGIVVDGMLRIYYGVADENMAVAETKVDDLVQELLAARKGVEVV